MKRWIFCILKVSIIHISAHRQFSLTPCWKEIKCPLVYNYQVLGLNFSCEEDYLCKLPATWKSLLNNWQCYYMVKWSCYIVTCKLYWEVIKLIYWDNFLVFSADFKVSWLFPLKLNKLQVHRRIFKLHDVLTSSQIYWQFPWILNYFLNFRNKEVIHYFCKIFSFGTKVTFLLISTSSWTGGPCDFQFI